MSTTPTNTSTPKPKPKGNPLADVAAKRRAEYQQKTGITNNQAAVAKASEYQKQRQAVAAIEKEKTDKEVEKRLREQFIDDRSKQEEKEWAKKLQQQVDQEQARRIEESQQREVQLERIRLEKEKKAAAERERLEKRQREIEQGIYNRDNDHSPNASKDTNKNSGNHSNYEKFESDDEH